MTTASFAHAVRNLSRAQRDHLLRHLDGAHVSTAASVTFQRTRAALIKQGLVTPMPHNAPRPRYTVATVAGREAIAVLLADAADAISRAGLIEQEVAGESPLALLKRMKAAKQAESARKLAESGLPEAHFPVDR